MPVHELESELKQAVRTAILKVGLDTIKRSEFFGTNESQAHMKLAA